MGILNPIEVAKGANLKNNLLACGKKLEAIVDSISKPSVSLCGKSWRWLFHGVIQCWFYAEKSLFDHVAAFLFAKVHLHLNRSWRPSTKRESIALSLLHSTNYYYPLYIPSATTFVPVRFPRQSNRSLPLHTYPHCDSSIYLHMSADGLNPTNSSGKSCRGDGA